MAINIAGYGNDPAQQRPLHSNWLTLKTTRGGLLLWRLATSWDRIIRLCSLYSWYVKLWVIQLEGRFAVKLHNMGNSSNCWPRWKMAGVIRLGNRIYILIVSLILAVQQVFAIHLKRVHLLLLYLSHWAVSEYKTQRTTI